MLINSEAPKKVEVSKRHHVYIKENNAIAVFCMVHLFIFKADFVSLTPYKSLLSLFALQINDYFGCNLPGPFWREETLSMYSLYYKEEL